jgi:transcriptional regulator with XRE-family HTH domain
MFDGGYRLRVARQDRSLTYRDVEHLSRILAQKYADDRYRVRISVLADIENRGRAPSIFRLHSLCLIYALNMRKVLGWFGVEIKASERSLVKEHRQMIQRAS